MKPPYAIGSVPSLSAGKGSVALLQPLILFFEGVSHMTTVPIVGVGKEERTEVGPW